MVPAIAIVNLDEVLITIIDVIPLLENESSEPIEEVLRHRFCNRYPQTETIGLSLGHRVFHPVP